MVAVTSQPDDAATAGPPPENTGEATPLDAAPAGMPAAIAADAAQTQAAQTQAEQTPAAQPEDAPAASAASPADQPSAAAAEPAPDVDEEEEDVPFRPPLELIDETVADEDLKFDWFILKVQVNREDSIKDALLRRVKMNGLDRYFREIVVPTEDVVEFTKTGKRRVVKKKLYPGYILVNMSVTDESWFMVRETPGIGDFTGASGKPTPMDPKDVERILRSSKVLPEEEGTGTKIGIPFKVGERVRVKEGYFQNFEGDVNGIDETHGRVTVMINIFGRATPVEIEHWQIEAV